MAIICIQEAQHYSSMSDYYVENQQIELYLAYEMRFIIGSNHELEPIPGIINMAWVQKNIFFFIELL